MKIEFENIREYNEFIQYIQSQTKPAEVTTQKQARNKHFLATESLHHKFKEIWEQLLLLENKLAENKQSLKQETAPVKTKEVKTIREYAPSIKEHATIIKKIDENGNLYTGRGKCKYNFNDLLRLESAIKNTTKYPTRQDVAEFFGYNYSTSQRLGYSIEAGLIDHIIETGKKQLIYSKQPTKKVEIVNNPEKRKELIGMG